MFDRLFSILMRGVDKVRGNPQLVYTIFIALLITGSFVFMAERFIGIAETAEERLINVRVGALQDAFVSFAGDRLTDAPYLNQRIADVMRTNETIRSFDVLVQQPVFTPEHGTSTGYVIVASGNPKNVGTEAPQGSFLYALASGNAHSSVTLPQQQGDERLFQTARAIVSGSGEVQGVVFTTQTLSLADQAIADDITSSRLLLFAIIVLVLVLFLRHARIIDYTTLYERLKELDQLKDDFISMASHELRTPLTVIRGYAEFVRAAPELREETKDYAMKIDRSSRELDALVADILDVSRLEQGRMQYTLAPLAPLTLVAEVVASFELPAKEKGLALSLDQGAVTGDERIVVDATRLKQNLVNVLGNAIKYTKQGSVTLRVYVEKGRLCLRVSDTGVGMTEEERAGLFGKFYRIRNDETKDIRGTGLGLWITAKMVKEMGGTLSVESIKGVGSHFILSFPLAS